MNGSRRHKLIFVAVPKTGTQAIRAALRRVLHPDDVIKIKTRVAGHPAHPTAAEIAAAFPDEFAASLKVAVVRNPFDRFISACAFTTHDGLFAKDPHIVMRRRIALLGAGRRPPLFIPQHEYIEISDSIAVDRVGRFEQLQDFTDEVCGAVGLEPVVLDRVNASVHAPYRDYYTPELRETVTQIYRRDLDLFGYEF